MFYRLCRTVGYLTALEQSEDVNAVLLAMLSED
jgi:hypothetical protein